MSIPDKTGLLTLVITRSGTFEGRVRMIESWVLLLLIALLTTQLNAFQVKIGLQGRSSRRLRHNGARWMGKPGRTDNQEGSVSKIEPA